MGFDIRYLQIRFIFNLNYIRSYASSNYLDIIYLKIFGSYKSLGNLLCIRS